MNTIHTITTAGLLVLTIGWFIVGVIVTSIISFHIGEESRRTNYWDGFRHGKDYGRSL